MRVLVEWALRHLRRATETYAVLLRERALPPWLGWCTIVGAVGYASLVIALAANLESCRPFSAVSLFPLFYVGLAALWRKMAQRDITWLVARKHDTWSPRGVALGVILFYTLLLITLGTFSSNDTINQWRQVQTAHFNDWHPVVHTIMLWLVAQVWESTFFVVWVQCLCFAALCGWLYATLRHYKYRLWIRKGILLFIVLSPPTTDLMRVLWKDTAFALTAMGLSIILLHVGHSAGRWLFERTWNWVLFVVLLFLTSFFRHNGIFLTAPLLILLPFVSKIKGEKKPTFRLLALSLVCGPLLVGYPCLRASLIRTGHIEQDKTQVFIESVGLPLSMMAEVYVTKPETAPPELTKLCQALAPRELWERHYHGEFNSVKFNFKDTGVKLQRAITPADFARLMGKTFVAAPSTCLRAFLRVTSLAWSPGFNGFGQNGVPGIRGQIAYLLRGTVGTPPVGWLFYAPGLYVLLWVLFGVYGWIRYGFGRAIYCLPFLSYAGGTALLLTGWDWRFFFVLGLCIFPTLLGLVDPRIGMAEYHAPKEP